MNHGNTSGHHTAKRKLDNISNPVGKSKTINSVYNNKDDLLNSDEVITKKRRKLKQPMNQDIAEGNQSDSININNNSSNKNNNHNFNNNNIACNGGGNKKAYLLPQKKRALVNAHSPNRSPLKKTVKISDGSETVDDETLIRETEAALKSLSGSWSGPRAGFYNKASEQDERYESPAFENLFDENKSSGKKMAQCSAVSSSSTTSDNSVCSLKDVITLRDTQSGAENQRCDDIILPVPGFKSEDHEKWARSGGASINYNSRRNSSNRVSTEDESCSNSCDSRDRQPGESKVGSKNDLDNLLKIENECESIQNQRQSSLRTKSSSSGSKTNERLVNNSGGGNNSCDGGAGIIKSERFPRYETDFNELVDDSSNELEIDMSDPSEKSDREHHSNNVNIKKEVDPDRKQRTTIKVEHDSQSQLQAQNQFVYGKHVGEKPFSQTSAFRPVSVNGVGGGGLEGGEVISKDSRSTVSDLPNAISMVPIGPYPPAGATFVGYPPASVSVSGPISGIASPCNSILEKSPPPSSSSLLQLKSAVKEEDMDTRSSMTSMASMTSMTSTASLGALPHPVTMSQERTKAEPPSTSVHSPDTLSSKQYITLQPASAGSRAATAIQEVAREGVLSVSAVSSTSSQSPGIDSPASRLMNDPIRAGGPFSPSSINKGKTRDTTNRFNPSPSIL